MESRVIDDLFGLEVPVSSTKPFTGHTLGAAAAIEAALCWLAMQDDNAEGKLPPHLWDGAADPALPALNVVPRRRAGAAAALGAEQFVCLRRFERDAGAGEDRMSMPDIRALVPHAGRWCCSTAPQRRYRQPVRRSDASAADSMLASEKGVGAWVGIEYMAQAVAAHAGWLAHAARRCGQGRLPAGLAPL
jgi:3-oxoacyl-[acyl-carrier-protein] synthase-1